MVMGMGMGFQTGSSGMGMKFELNGKGSGNCLTGMCGNGLTINWEYDSSCIGPIPFIVYA